MGLLQRIKNFFSGQKLLPEGTTPVLPYEKTVKEEPSKMDQYKVDLTSEELKPDTPEYAIEQYLMALLYQKR